MSEVSRESWRAWPEGTRVNVRLAEKRTAPGSVVGRDKSGNPYSMRSLVAVHLDGGVPRVDGAGRVIMEFFKARKLTQRIES